ncbi:MAG: helix-turn-helix domain-containing protein [Pseudonocardiaceae bacterium]
MRITTTVEVDAGTLTIEVEGRVELLPLDVVPRFLATALADAQATAVRLLATGLTDQQVAETLGVAPEQVRRWDDDAVTDAERDRLVDGWGLP